MGNLNLNYIKELSAGDKIFEKKLISILKDEFPKESSHYYACLKNNDLKKTAEIVHKIKHKISILGFNKGYKIANTFEQELKMKKIELSTDFEKILDEIALYLKSIPK